MRIGILQNNPTIGAVDKNYSWMESQIRKHAPATELFITPELALIGYPARDLLSQRALIIQEQAALERLRSLSQELKVGILVGHTETRSDFIGKPFYNAATLIDSGTQIGRVRKHRIPAYDIFEEERFFERWPEGRQAPLRFRGKILSISICEDGWESIQAFGFRDVRSYPRLTPSSSDTEKVDLMINLSASPYSLKKRGTREDLFGAQAVRARCPLIYSNSAGAQDDLIFDGGSFAATVDGKVTAQAKLFAEDFLALDWNSQSGQIQSTQRPEPFQLWPELELALITGLKNFIHKSGGEKVLLGLSGGIDSALVAVLATKALGASNVLGVSLPSSLTSDLSKDLGRESAKRLGIEFREIPIASVVEEHRKLLKLSDRSLAFENLQSRNRGLLLMGIANAEGRFLLATGNKSEFALGYSTLYGDMAGALCPIGDLYKTEVYGLSHFLNRKEELIPPETLSRAPTAELATGQKDSDSLPDYEILDGFLYEILENQGQTVFKEESWNKILAPKQYGGIP